MRAMLRRVLLPGLCGALVSAGAAYVHAMNGFLSTPQFVEEYGLPVSQQTMAGWLSIDQRLSVWLVIVGCVGAIASVTLIFMIRLARRDD